MSLAKTVGARITHARKIRDMSAKNLSQLLNVAPQTVSNWEKGRKTPTIVTLIKITECLNISIEFLSGLSDAPYGLDSRQFNITDIQNIETDNHDDLIRIPDVFLQGENTNLLVFRVTDDSMENLFRKNDVVIVNQDKPLSDGCYVLFKINKTGQLLFRKYTIDNLDVSHPVMKFVALNEKYSEINYEPQAISVIGVCRDDIRLIG